MHKRDLKALKLGAFEVTEKLSVFPISIRCFLQCVFADCLTSGRGFRKALFGQLAIFIVTTVSLIFRLAGLARATS